MVYFYTKNPTLGIFWRPLEWKMLVCQDQENSGNPEFYSSFTLLDPYSETCSNLRHSNLQQKAVFPDLFAMLPNVFHHINFTILNKHCRCNFRSRNTIFEIKTY
jgi:hypothetical protein